MKLVIDMNMSPEWVTVFEEHGISAVHWSQVGDPRAHDEVIMKWAVEHASIVFTHDLDFGAMLAATYATAPSVIQVRTQDILPQALASTVLNVIDQFTELLEVGALIVIDRDKLRARILPLRRSEQG